MIPGVRGPAAHAPVRDCGSCGWFARDRDVELGSAYQLGTCGRPEGPLDPRLSMGTQAPVSARTGLVSSGMGCQAHQVRDPADVIKVTDSGGPQPDLWAEP